MKILALITVLVPLAAAASTITVDATADNTTASDGKCTLREAIANVNAASDTTNGDCAAGSGAGDTILFNLQPPATIKLALGEFVVDKDLTINGLGGLQLTIDGNRKTRVFNITAGTTNMSDLRIAHGKKSGEFVGEIIDGGGVFVDPGAGLVLTNCALFHNSAPSYGSGGGAIYNNGGTVTLTNCTLRGNRAFSGGAIVSHYGTTTLTNCTLERNSATHGRHGGGGGGGGIVSSGTITLTNCTFRGNRAVVGGAIASGGTATLTNCTLDRNSATAFAGGIYNGGTVILTNCTLRGNKAKFGSGGAIYSEDGTSTLTNCVLYKNISFGHPYYDFDWGGGGLANYGGTATLTNCTLYRNLAKGPYNHGDGLHNKSGGSVTLTNTIIAASAGRRNCFGDITSGGHNLSSDNTCFAGGGSDLLSTPPMLAPLANYGGPTDTLALCTGPYLPHPPCAGASPAIDAGDDVVTEPPDNITTDQRGLPRLSGAHVDIGAYELQQ